MQNFEIFENFLKKIFVINYFLFFFFMDVLYRRRRDHTVKPFWNFHLFLFVFKCFHFY